MWLRWGCCYNPSVNYIVNRIDIESMWVLDILGIGTIIKNLSFSKLEWAGIIGPVAALILYHYLIRGPAHDLFHSGPGIGVLTALAGFAIVVFSRSIFLAIKRAQRDLTEMTEVVSNQNAQLRALNEANFALSEERLVSSTLQRVVDLSRELAQVRYAALSIAGENGGISAFLTSGMDEATRESIGPPPTGEGILGLTLNQTEPVRLNDVAAHAASVGYPPGHPDMKNLLGVPIAYNGRVIGSLYLVDKINEKPFTAQDEEIVTLFSNQAAVAIQNADLYEQIQALAVEGERTRISREMHDGLAQVVSYVNTKAQAVEVYLSRGELESAQGELADMSKSARQVYKDIREGILALRTQVGLERSLHEALIEYLEEYQHQIGRDTHVSWQVPESLDLSPLQEVQILRIIQEALTNVRKHAEATEISVNLSQSETGLTIMVEDNGNGFNPVALKRGAWPQLGLQTMQERAEAIGSIFEMESFPGRGTRVRLSVPRAGNPVQSGDEQ